MRWSRSAIVTVTFAVIGLLPSSAAFGGDVASRSPDGILTLQGHGFGHGRGMSQYGAYGAAIRGLSYDRILSFYYTGASLGATPSAQRRVLVTAEDADMVVTNAPGLLIKDTAGTGLVDAGSRREWSQVRVRQDGAALVAEGLNGSSWVPVFPGAAAGPIQLYGPATVELRLPSGRPRSYRGALTAALSGQSSKPVYVVNTVSTDDYVRGVVPVEMPSSWSMEALKAQAVAARSYGSLPCPQPSSYPGTGLYDVIDTTACQVYGGSSAEVASSNSAVDATAGQVLLYNGSVLRSEFSASNGGWTVAAGGVFQAKPDPYDQVGAQAANAPQVSWWTGVRVPLSPLEAAYGTGAIRTVTVLSRDGRGDWGGRVLRVRLAGDVKSVDVTGDAFASRLGLRSNWFDLSSPIDDKYAAIGGAAGLLGAPLTSEEALSGGLFRQYQNGSIYWSPATNANEVHGSIRAKWGSTGWENGPLGYPSTDETSTPDGAGRYNHFQGGSVYWTPTTGAYAVQGSIRATWAALRWEAGPLGFPLTDETTTPDRVGRYNHFQGGSVYWSPSTGAWAVQGSIRDRWSALRWEMGPLGYPTTNETVTPDGVGRYNHFQGGSVYWSPTTGARDIEGPLRDAWAALRWEAGPLGYPVSSQAPTTDGAGRFVAFQGGSVYWSAATGAHDVRGAIRDRWFALGAEGGFLGYPVTGEREVPGGRQSDFQQGSIFWNATTGTTTVVPAR